MDDTNDNFAPRPIDHCVLPVASLETARARLAALGFTVAPEGRHPFGTVNACVFLADGTFLEPLAIGDAGAVETAIAQGNTFLSRDRAFRRRFGDDGFAALVVGSSSAARDHARFVERGLSAGAPLEFVRPFESETGQTDEAGFRLAFAAAENEPAAFVFTCERTNMPAVDRSGLERHDNGALGIARILAIAADPEVYAPLLGELTLSRAEEMDGSGLRFSAGNGEVCVLTPEAARSTGLDASPDRGLTFAAIVFRTGDAGRTAALLSAASVDFMRRDHHIVVPAAPGQGAAFVFEEES